MDTSRRDFLKTAGGVAAATSFIGAPLALGGQVSAQVSSAGELTSHELPPLPYAYDALEPYIDEQTMRIHHDKHHAGYVKGLNSAEQKLAEARAAGDYDLIQYWTKKASFHGGGHFLHSMFWKVMGSPGKAGGGMPGGIIAKQIDRDFGGFDMFKAQFSAAAKAVEGSGWGLLAYRFMDGRLLVLQGENQNKLSPWDAMPILGVDVWEHAYYLKYQNNRGAYVDNWWNVVNWSMVDKNLQICLKLHQALMDVHVPPGNGDPAGEMEMHEEGS